MFDRSARLGFATNPLDREGTRRGDAAHLAARLADPAARFVVFAGDVPVLRREGKAASGSFDREEVRALAAASNGAGGGTAADTVFAEAVFLGVDARGPAFGVGLEPSLREALAAQADLLVTDMRSVAVRNLLSPAELGAVGEAKALVDWHARHRFCARCGRMTTLAVGGWRRDCAGAEGCGAQHFPRVDPVTIMLVVDEGGGHCLLGRQPRFPPGMMSCLAGFVEPGETIEDAVRREVMEETGVAVGPVAYVCAQPWPFPSSLMIGCRAVALGPADPAAIRLDREELEDAGWFSREEVALMLEGRHEGGRQVPPPSAIAHHLLKDFADGL